MNIQFESLKLSNFLSLGSVQVDLRERGFVLVEGVNKNVSDNAKSNGSGKSSLFEGIVWILTGDTIRGTKDVVNKAVGRSTCGELEFTIDGNKYKIIRYREDLTYGNGLKVFFNGADVSGKGVRDSSKILEQYLPDLNAQLLGSVIVLGQGLPQRFTNNTPSGRKEILEQLSKSDFMIEDIKSKLSLRRVDVNTELRNVKDTIISKNSSISSYNVLIDRKKAELVSLPDPSLYADKIKDAENRCDEAKSALEGIKSNIEELTARTNDLTARIGDTQSLLDSEQKAETAPLLESIQEINKSVSVEQYKESDLEKKIRDAQNVQTVCPYCRRPFDEVHKVDTSEWQSELIQCQTKLATLKDELRIKNADVANIEDKYRAKKADLNSWIRERNDINAEINEKNRQTFTYQSNIHNAQLEVVKYKEQLDSLDARKKSIGDEINNYYNLIETETAEVTRLTKEQGDLESRVEALNKLVNIASKDFRTYLLESVIDYINSRVKYYSSKLFNSTDAEFRNDGNQIWIGFAGKQYENLSGGEKQKLDIIVQFALRDMLMKILRFSCNMLVLDEVFDNLDEVGCENLISLITNELRDIESVYIITHHSDISVPYDDKIQIVKNEEGISNIESNI